MPRGSFSKLSPLGPLTDVFYKRARTAPLVSCSLCSGPRLAFTNRAHSDTDRCDIRAQSLKAAILDIVMQM